MLRNIEAERVRKGYTKEMLASKLEISQKTYYNWINEDTDIPSSALIKMSKLFHVSVDYLLNINPINVMNESDQEKEVG